MTNKEAIKELQEIKAAIDNVFTFSADRKRDALDLAAEALEHRPKGKWEMKENEYIRALICSECRSFTMTAYNFCPSCGADMREEGEP